MKKVEILLSLVVLFTVSCGKSELETQQVPNVSVTPCEQGGLLKSSGLSDKSDKVDVEFTNQGVQITHYNFEVTCDFTTVNVTHTFVTGVLNITQQGSPNQADCICYTDVSYTIDGIYRDEVNVIFINGVQVYCHNDKDDDDDSFFNATVLGIGGDCRTYLIQFDEDIENTTGHSPLMRTYYAPNLPEEYGIKGTRISVKFRVPKNDELMVCTTMGPAYGQVYIVEVKYNQSIDWTNKTAELRIHNENKISITEGIWGTLVKTEGNCMPVVNFDFCKQYPVKREIVIYEYTKMDETRHEFTKFFEIYTKLVAITTCDEEGFFEFVLEPGKYSVFVKEGEYFYANLFDGQGGIEPAIVESSKVSKKDLNLNYASY